MAAHVVSCPQENMVVALFLRLCVAQIISIAALMATHVMLHSPNVTKEII
jgi:hypothetical protein